MQPGIMSLIYSDIMHSHLSERIFRWRGDSKRLWHPRFFEYEFRKT